ncbi:MAG: NAD(P)-binding domain-containing protein, partial [Sphingomonadales bacterium]
MHIPSIGIVGSGKVAQMLLRMAHAAGIPISGIYARDLDRAHELAIKYSCSVFSELHRLKPDLLLLCVSDDALPQIIGSLAPQQIAAYTAGSPSIKLFEHAQLGVCYPYQSISKGRDLLASDIPFMIEGKNDLVLQRITDFLNA